MSDHRRLIGKLLTMAAPDASIQDGWRLVGDPMDRDPVASILREIDETQLPRSLEFRNDQGQTLCLVAGNRRLRRITSVSWADAGTISRLSDKELSKATETEIEEISALLRVIQPGDRTIRVRSEALTGSHLSSGNGVLAATLARNWSIDLVRRADEDLRRSFAEFVELLKPLSNAWLTLENGQLAEASHPGTDVFDGWITIDPSTFRNDSAPVAGAPVLCIFGTEPDRETCHIVAGSNSTLAVFLADADSITEVSQKWRDLGL